MPTIDEYKAALVKADKDGDTAAAELFASKIRELQGGDRAVKASPAETTDYSVPAAAAMKFTEGATMGFADEASGALAAAMSYPASLFSDRISGETEGMGFGDRYQMYRDRERERLANVQEQSPVTSTVSNIAGTVAGAAVPASRGLTAFKAGQGTRAMMGAGAAEGAIYGGISGAGYSDADTAGGVAADTGIGSVAGAATGGATPLVTQPLSGAAQAFASRFKPAAEQAADRVTGALRRAGVTPDQIAQRMANAGDEAMLIDVMGAEGQNLGRAAINASGEADDILGGAVDARQATQNTRVAESIMDAAGLDGPMTLGQIQQSIDDTNRPAIARAYNAARDQGFDMSLFPYRDLMRIPMFRDAVDGARASAQNYLPDANRPGGRLGFLDEVKKNLDDVAESAMRSGDKNRASQAGALARELRTRVDDNIPSYGGARDLARQNFAEQEAAELGAAGARQRVPADFIGATQSATDREASAIARAYGAGMVDRLENAASTPNSVRSILDRTRPRQALEAALGDKSGPVIKQLEAERLFGKTAQALRGNSTTAKQLMSMGGLPALGGGGTFFATGDPATSAGVTAGLAAARFGGGKVLGSMNARNESLVAPVVADILAGREVPEVVVRAIRQNPELQGLIARTLAIQSGAN